MKCEYALSYIILVAHVAMSRSYVELQCIVCNLRPSQQFELWILELEMTFKVEVEQLTKLQAHHNSPTTTSHMTICTLHNQVFFIKKKSQNHEAHKSLKQSWCKNLNYNAHTCVKGMHYYVGKNEDCKLATSTNPTIENIGWEVILFLHKTLFMITTSCLLVNGNTTLLFLCC